MDIQIRTVSARWVAYRRATSTHEKLGETITSPAMLPGIYDLAKKQGVTAGAPFARYTDWRKADCDLLIGIPLSGRMEPEDDILVDYYSACRAVVADYWGPYSGLPGVHTACRDYIDSEGLVYGGPCWERYDGPGDAAGNARTVVYWPIEP